MFTSFSLVGTGQAFKGALAANSKKRSPACFTFRTSEDQTSSPDDDDAEDNYSIDTSIERKIRRLTVQQVASLESKFEIENKLEPELKKQLSKELGLQPRQVAIWFQNRRARWKTKQMEKDFDTLKAKYDALSCDYALLLKDKKKLLEQVLRLNEKLQNADGVDSEKEKLGNDSKNVQSGPTLKAADVLVEQSMGDERPGWIWNFTPNKKGLDAQDLTHTEDFPLKTEQNRSWSSHSDDSSEFFNVGRNFRPSPTTHSMAEQMSFSDSTGQESANEQTSMMHFGEDKYLPLAYQISATKYEDPKRQEGYYNHFAVSEDQFPGWWDRP